MSWPRRVTDEQLNKADAERLRDTFAAAALAGIIANEGAGPSLSNTCAYAYRIADAMLRERERTNHDAAPEARAKPSSTGHAATLDTAVVAGLQRESVGTGNTPILTDEEREAIAWGIACVTRDKHAATLRSLLDRLA
jgi:hypothetical protein